MDYIPSFIPRPSLSLPNQSNQWNPVCNRVRGDHQANNNRVTIAQHGIRKWIECEQCTHNEIKLFRLMPNAWHFVNSLHCFSMRRHFVKILFGKTIKKKVKKRKQHTRSHCPVNMIFSPRLIGFHLLHFRFLHCFLLLLLILLYFIWSIPKCNGRYECHLKRVHMAISHCVTNSFKQRIQGQRTVKWWVDTHHIASIGFTNWNARNKKKKKKQHAQEHVEKQKQFNNSRHLFWSKQPTNKHIYR